MNMPFRRFATLFTIAVISVAGLGAAQPAAMAGEPTDSGSMRAQSPDRGLLYHRHVDAAHIAWDADADAPSVVIIDGQDPVPADSVYIRLGPDADPDGNEISRMAVPKDASFSFLGKPGDIIWSGPQTSYDNNQPVWAGMGAGAIPDAAAKKLDLNSLRLQLVDLRGPGRASAFTVNGGKATPVQNLDNPTKWMRVGSHGHYFWGFSKPGRYEFDYQVIIDGRDGVRHASPVTTVTWLVGPDAAFGFPEGTTKQAYPITITAERQRDETGGLETGGGETGKPETGGDEAGGSAQTSPGDPDGTGNDMAGVPCIRADTATVSVSFADDPDSEYPPYADARLIVDGKEADEDHSGLIDVTDGEIVRVPSSNGLNEFLKAGSKAYRATVALDTTAVETSALRRGYLTFDYWDIPGWMAVTDADGGDALVFASTPQQTRRFDYDLDAIAGVKTLSFWFDTPGYYAPTINIQLERKRPAANGETRQTYADRKLGFAVGNAEISRSCTGVDADALPQRPVPTPPIPEGDDRTETRARILDAGHLDVFHARIDANGLRLAISEDITGAGVLRDPEQTLMYVKPDAWTADMPKTLDAGGGAFLLPLTQDENLLWPGWDTNALKGTGYERSRFEFVDVTGPGEVLLYTLRGFSGYAPIAVGGRGRVEAASGQTNPYALASGSRIVVNRPNHDHAFWAFTKPGVYTMKVRAVASGEKGELTSATHTYTWKVGGSAPVHVSDEENDSPGTDGTPIADSGDAVGETRDDRHGPARQDESDPRTLPSTGGAITGIAVAMPVLAAIGVGGLAAVRRRSRADGNMAALAISPDRPPIIANEERTIHEPL